MTCSRLQTIGAFAAVVVLMAGGAVLGAGQASGRGTIRGHVRLAGKLPGNSIIRMSADPMCSRMNAGKRVVQEVVAASLDGSLANVFVSLQGSFPQNPVPNEPVRIDQRGCVYVPRMVGVRAGQVLEVRNSDALLHNVHGLSDHDNGINVGQPRAGMVAQLRLRNEEVVMRLKCDLHSWMTAFVGIVSHPYFAVSDAAGTFDIRDVPVGTHTIQTWHERYGPLTQTIRVRAGATTAVEFTYTGSERPRTAGLPELVVPMGALAGLVARPEQADGFSVGDAGVGILP